MTDSSLQNPFRRLLTEEPTTRAERIRVTKLGQEKLALYAEAWDALSQVYATRTERRQVRDKYAALLGVEPRTLNAIAKPEFKKPERIREIRAHYLATADKKLGTVKAAISVIAGSESAADAAVRAETTERTVYRRVGTLLATQGLVTEDLRHLSNTKRVEVAQAIESTILPTYEKIKETRRQQLQTDREIRRKAK